MSYAIYNRQNLNQSCYDMVTRGGYILGFAWRVASDIPDLTWKEFECAVLNNGHGFCGYHSDAVKTAFNKARAGV